MFYKTNELLSAKSESYTQEYQKHEPSGYCLFLKGLDGFCVNYKLIVYTKKTEDEDISKKFIKHVGSLTHKIYRKYYKNPKSLKLTPQEQQDFLSAKVSHIYEQELNIDKETGHIFKVRDHCHFIGEYRGTAHNECNLKCRKPLILPVVFHNLQGYDSHLFIKQLAKVSGVLSCIPSTEEKYISFSKKIKVGEYFSIKKGKPFPINFEIRFIDSYKFLQTSLANLVSNLQPSGFKNLNRVIKENTSLLTRKGVYPYDYVSSIHQLKETKLPSKEDFYSKLNDEEISEEDYQHAIKVWNTFNCQTLQDYHDLYLKSDVLPLADVFENFRKTCLLDSYKIEEQGEKRKAKGVKKNVIKKSLSFDDYKKCLFTEETMMKEMNILRIQKHEIFSMTVNKVALSSNDDKRLICENKIDSYALR